MIVVQDYDYFEINLNEKFLRYVDFILQVKLFINLCLCMSRINFQVRLESLPPHLILTLCSSRDAFPEQNHLKNIFPRSVSEKKLLL